jgi:hypothetical protein
VVEKAENDLMKKEIEIFNHLRKIKAKKKKT